MHSLTQYLKGNVQNTPHTHYWPIDVCHLNNGTGRDFENTLVEKRGITGKNFLRKINNSMKKMKMQKDVRLNPNLLLVYNKKKGLENK